ncbi:MAG: AbrB/MazE/SpoVT family DNA-binding domain-containing protein [Candidatus Aenigmarchaeota archaeon]|nr:AbrB/MazE/SpoVT family DNA-binding domain-containing protein [Candidatus Aenigmarchaeota archaeon]
MTVVTISSKFQVVIPKQIRENMELRPKEKMVIIEKQGTIHLVPVENIKKLRGFLKDMSSKNMREEHDRFD